MKTARRRQTTWIIAASALGHVAVLTLAVLQHPTLTVPAEPSGPPQAIIPILILPRTPPPVGGRGVRPAPIQLHQRQLRTPQAPAPVAPLVIAAPKPAPAPAPPTGPAVAREVAPPPPAPPSDAVRAALRTTLGCTDLRLSREERANCVERLGRGARDAPYFGQPLSAEKRTALDEAGAAKLANRATQERPLSRPGPPPPTDYSGDPYFSGAGQDILGPVTLPPSKRAAPKLQRLPP